MTETLLSDTFRADSIVQLGTLKYITDYFDNKIDNMVDESALRGVALKGNSFQFFTTTDTALNPAFNFDLPVEKYLDVTKTTAVNNFVFDSSTYVGATDPQLDGKGVIVFGVNSKSNDGQSETTNYSFLDGSALMGDMKNYIRQIVEDENGLSFIDGNGTTVYRLNVL